MVKNVRTSGDGTGRDDYSAEFGKRLYRLLLDKGWTQADLVRRTGLPRDSISMYVRGNTVPKPVNAKRLAEALEIGLDELLPNYSDLVKKPGSDEPVVKIDATGDTAHLVVNQFVTLETALRIAQLLKEDNAANREGSSDAIAS